MAEPTSALSFYDLILRIAREAGIAYHGSGGNERAMIPIDPHDLDLCKQIVNDGIRMFIADAPAKGWRWMRRIMSITLTATRITGTVDSSSGTTLVDAALCAALGAMTAEAGTNATTLVDATLTATYDTDDELIGSYCYIISGTGAGSYAPITDYDASTGTITVADWLTASGQPGGTDPISTDTFGISAYKIQVGYYCYITAGTGIDSWAVITAFDSSDGMVTVADWLTAYGNAGGTDPTVGSTFAITPIETVAGDISRYPLAENFGGEVNGNIEYAASTGHGAPIEWRDEAFIRADQAVSISTHYPQYAAIRPLEYRSSGAGPKRRWELILDSNPSAADVLEFPYTLSFDKLDLLAGPITSVSGTDPTFTVLDSEVDDLYPDDYFIGWTIKIISGTGKNSRALVTDSEGGTSTFVVAGFLNIDNSVDGKDPAAGSVYVVEPPGNLHPAGLRFDEAVKAACFAQAEMDVEDVAAGFMNKYIQGALPKAYLIDVRSAPRKLGNMNRGQVRYRTWSDVTYD